MNAPDEPYDVNVRQSDAAYVRVSQVWTRRELPCELAAAGPSVRVVGSLASPGEFVFEVHAMGDVVSVRLDDDVLAELHRQAMAVRRAS